MRSLSVPGAWLRRDQALPSIAAGTALADPQTRWFTLPQPPALHSADFPPPHSPPSPSPEPRRRTAGRQASRRCRTRSPPARSPRRCQRAACRRGSAPRAGCRPSPSAGRRGRLGSGRGIRGIGGVGGNWGEEAKGVPARVVGRQEQGELVDHRSQAVAEGGFGGVAGGFLGAGGCEAGVDGGSGAERVVNRTSARAAVTLSCSIWCSGWLVK